MVNVSQTVPFLVNPFATRYVRPGAIPWIDVPYISMTDARNQIVHRASQFSIVGPHGSGKSTLLEHLLRPLGTVRSRFPSNRDSNADLLKPFSPDLSREQNFTPELKWQIDWIVARRGNGFERALRKLTSELTENSIVVVDGAEQLGFIQRLQLISSCYTSRARLVATTHRPLLGLKTLVQTKPTPEILQAIVERVFKLQQLAIPPLFANRQNVNAIYDRCGGDLRESLMHCHDLYRDLCSN